MKTGRTCFGILLVAMQIVAADPTDPTMKVAPLPSQGSISPSGKFTPAFPETPSDETVPRTKEDAELALKRLSEVRQTGPDTFQLGLVSFDREKKTVTFPASICLREDVIEYALVTTHGKTYESLLSTKVSPLDLHLAMLLLGAAQVPVPGAFNQAAPVPGTNAVGIEISWQTNQQTVTFPLAGLVCLTDGSAKDPGRPMTLERWLYNGSEFNSWGFEVLREGSLVALIRDSSALVNNPGADRDNDHIHVPNTKILPPVGTPVQVVLSLARATEPTPVPLPGVTPITPLSTNQFIKP